MDLCQKNETSGSNGPHGTEDAELTCCPDERTERSQVCCLLSISDLTLEQDGEANEFVIGTGWEEAVQGWGKISPTACIWPRKKLKKARVGESAHSSCLLCLHLPQGSPEARPAGPRKLEAGAAAEVGSEKDQSSPSQSQGPPQGSNTASRDISKIYFPTYIHGEKKSLQIKEFIWCMEDWAIPKTGRGKALRSPGEGANRGLSISDSLTSKALLVLPPLKASPPNGLDKRAPTSLLSDPEPCSLPENKQMCLPNPSSAHYLTTLKLLQKQGVPNYKARFRARIPKPPVSTHKHMGIGSGEEDRSQRLDTKVFPRSLLPSLTVSRLVIPISTHRFL